LYRLFAGHLEIGMQMTANNSVQRTGEHRGRTVRAAALLRGPVRMGVVAAAELDC